MDFNDCSLPSIFAQLKSQYIVVILNQIFIQQHLWIKNSHLFLFITSTNCTEISYLDHTGLPETIFPEKQTKKAEKISWICVCFSGNIISGSAVYLNKNLGSISKQQLWLNGRALDYKSGGLWIESHRLLNDF